MIDHIKCICRSINEIHAKTFTMFQLLAEICVLIILLYNLQKQHGGLFEGYSRFFFC